MDNKQNFTKENEKVVLPSEPTDETIKPVIVSESDEEKVVIGKVVDCSKLRLREKPSTTADVVDELAADDEVELDMEKSTSDFYAVKDGDDIIGYVMKAYISIEE